MYFKERLRKNILEKRSVKIHFFEKSADNFCFYYQKRVSPKNCSKN